jgi:hypothetical protein
MPHIVVSFGDHSREDSGFSFSHSNFPIEIITVHQCKGIEYMSDGEFIEGLVGKLSL